MRNSSCPLPKNYEEYAVVPVKVVGPFTTQHLLLAIAGGAAVVTNIISFFLIMKHLHRYTESKQQRQIIRIIFFPPVYATLSAISIINYEVAQYMRPLIELYETFALAALFMLFVEYVAPDSHTRMPFFATLENRKPKSTFRPSKGYTVIPGGSQKWYSIKVLGVFLYLVVDIVMTVVEEVTMALGTYCETSWSPKFAHIWTFIITNFFLGWAITAIVNFYTRFVKDPEFSVHKPGLKLISFKLIVFINFVQSIVFAVINVKTSAKFTPYDLKLGMPAAVVAIEQILFAIFFHYSFRSREYHETMKEDLVSPRMGTFRAAANAFNPSDYFAGVFTAFKLLFGGFGKKSGGNAQFRGRMPNESSDHLEPMSQKYSHVPTQDAYPAPPYGIAVTAPQHAYEGLNYGQTGYQQQTGFVRDDFEGETDRLNPYSYARTHSRDSSVDATNARTTRDVV